MSDSPEHSSIPKGSHTLNMPNEEVKSARSQEPLSWKKGLEKTAYGFSMGTANVIPGVSGGTMALVHGIYKDLIEAIRSANLEFAKNIFQLKWKRAFKILHWRFLLPVGLGVVIAVVSLARVIPYFLEHHRAPICAMFFGLISASAVLIGREIEKWSLPALITGVLFTAGSFVLVGLLPVQTPDAMWFIFLTGFVSFMAMLLPGLSGAFVLLVLGKYTYILNAVQELAYHGRLQALIPLGVFALGSIVGVLCLARVLSHFLEHYRSATMAALVGLMLGSLRKLWPWREVEEWTKVGEKTIPLEEANRIPASLDTEVLVSVGLFIVGVFLIMIFEKIAHRKSDAGKQEKTEPAEG